MKRLHRTGFVVGLSCILGLTACQNNDTDSVSKMLDSTESSYSQDELTLGYNEFAFKLLQNCALESGNNMNVMISPTSVMLALEMAEAGAVGKTGEEIIAMFAPDAERGEVQSYAIDMAEQLNNADTVTMNVANSVWINEDTMLDRINGDYVAYLEDNFGALATTLPFDTNALGTINSWVEQQTNGMIDQILDDFNDDSCLLLINAIAFEGKWAIPYEDYQIEEGTFTNSDGTTSNVTMLSGCQNVYFESENATGFLQNYEGGEYAFIAMLPKNNQSANEFVVGLTAESYQEFVDSANSEYMVITQIPEFTSEYDIEMSNILAGPMGMPTAFNRGSADFSGMVLPGETNIAIDCVIHKTYIELDRSGTSAAAATAVEMRNGGSEPVQDIKEVYLNRPFAYAIVDTETMTPIFIGTMNIVAE